MEPRPHEPPNGKRPLNGSPLPDWLSPRSASSRCWVGSTQAHADPVRMRSAIEAEFREIVRFVGSRHTGIRLPRDNEDLLCRIREAVVSVGFHAVAEEIDSILIRNLLFRME